MSRLGYLGLPGKLPSSLLHTYHRYLKNFFSSSCSGNTISSKTALWNVSVSLDRLFMPMYRKFFLHVYSKRLLSDF